jgi:hypothetical protein
MLLAGECDFAPLLGSLLWPGTWHWARTPFRPYLGDLFERENVGSLFGVLTLGWGLVGGVPLVGADRTGSYGPALLLSAVCYAGAACSWCVLMVHPWNGEREMRRRKVVGDVK